jgi:hypothetical protein
MAGGGDEEVDMRGAAAVAGQQVQQALRGACGGQP